MSRARCISTLALVAAFSAVGPAVVADPERPGPAFLIIVHPSNAVTALDRDFVRDAFLKKVATWRSNETIRPVDLHRRLPLRARFTRDLLQKTPTQLRSYWNRLIFSGKGVPPPELASEEAVVSYVLANRGAVGYVSPGTNPRGARVVRLK